MSENERHDETEINKEYSHLLLKLQETKEKQSSVLENTLSTLRQKTDILFTKIKKPSTLKLDARLLNESTHLSHINFEKSMEKTEASLDAFMELVIRDKFDDYVEIAQKCFYGVNFYKTLALDNPSVRRQAQSTNKIKIDTEPEVPKTIHENKETDSNMEIPVKIKKIIEEMGAIEYFRLIIDVDSFTKTIENTFYLAFAIKQKLCSLQLKNDKLYVINEYIDSEYNNHIILELTYADYTRIIKSLNIETSYIK